MARKAVLLNLSAEAVEYVVFLFTFSRKTENKFYKNVNFLAKQCVRQNLFLLNFLWGFFLVNWKDVKRFYDVGISELFACLDFYVYPLQMTLTCLTSSPYKNHLPEVELIHISWSFYSTIHPKNSINRQIELNWLHYTSHRWKWKSLKPILLCSMV